MRVNKASYFQVALNVLLPIIGILFFGWSIADIYFLFFMELLFLGAFTILKMLFCVNDGTLWSRVGRILEFILAYTILFLLVTGLMGQFWDGSKAQSVLTANRGIVLLLAGSYGADFLVPFLIAGQFKRKGYASFLRREALYRMLDLFLVMFVILVPFGSLLRSGNVNIALGIAIVLARNIVDVFMIHRANLHLASQFRH